MIPHWQFALITLAIGLAGVALICAAFALGLKHGIEGAFEDLDERGEK